jgi:ribosomal 30S subunit maturation factor RimM
VDEEATTEYVEIRPLKHTKWTLLVLGASWLASVARETAETLQMVSIAAAQHNLHKREEDEFYEIVGEGDG